MEEAALTAAIEGSDPQNALIKLIQGKETPAGGEQAAAGGDTKEATDGGSLDTLPAMLRAALEGNSTRNLPLLVIFSGSVVERLLVIHSGGGR